MERVIFLIILFMFSGLYSVAAEIPFDRISAGMDKVKTFSADYSQVKKFKILSRPLKLSGRIYIRRNPFKLGWHVDRPVKSLTVMDGDTLKQWDESGSETLEIKMADNPVMKTVADTYRSMLTGDFSTFKKNCKMNYVGTSRCLNVVPGPESNMGRFIKKISFYFSTGLTWLERIDIEELRGSSTVIIFKNAAVNKPLASEAWQIKK